MAPIYDFLQSDAANCLPGASLLPASTQGAIERDGVRRFFAPDLYQSKLRFQQLAFGVEVVQVTGYAAAVSQIGELHGLP